VKRFLVENENKEEIFITEHEKSELEIVSTDWRPVAEVVFAKVKGIQKENQIIDLEQFISVKGIKALGNQLTTDKIKQINLMDSLPYEEIIEEPETMAEEHSEESTDIQDFNIELNEDGQITLSLD
jgi:topoisomerase-4 subunit A